MTNRLLALSLLLVAVFAGFYLYNKFRVAPSIDFSKLPLTDLEGKPFHFDDLKGKKTVLCFSATWCGSCWQELAALDDVRETSLKDVEIVVISDEPAERIANFNKRLRGPNRYLKLNTDFASINIHSIPVSYVLDKNMAVKKEQVGYIDWKDPSTLEHLKTLME